MKRKNLLLLISMIILAMLIAACGAEPEVVTRIVTETETITEQIEVEVTRMVEGESITETIIEEVTRVVEVVTEGGGDAGAVSEFHTAWPYQAPPAGHFNTFVSDRIDLGIYLHIMQPPLFFYLWSDADWMPLAGDSWEWVDDTTLQVKIHEGAVWSDGSAFTTQDVIDTFDIARLQSLTVWQSVVEVVAVDDYTVNFLLDAPSTTAPRRILREVNIRPSSTYGSWAEQVRGLVDQGLTSDADEWSALLQDFNEFRPDDMVVLGPYKIDQDSITESQMILNKNESSFMADWVNFDRIVNFNGETPDVTP
ncbi:MAG: hypothetical protein KDE04_25145, partial [Anaerolineales bacterium]|nr:hypothetical protein [Anaerolineales bacterium]